MKKRPLTQEDLASLLYPDQQEDFAESIVDITPEKRRLQTETMDYTVSSLIDKFRKGDVYIPNFQRNYEWQAPQASRLIESLIIQCPIPVIYLSQDSDERLSVIDGNQRINAINKFLNDEFQLTGLTVYPELSGKKYSDLDHRFQRHIQGRVLRCLTILKETHPQIKFDVFERLNTGSLKLTYQELRHGIYFGDLIKVCTDIADKIEKDDLKLFGKTSRMKIEELVLRFIAFHTMRVNYSKPLTGFLNTVAEKGKKLSKKDQLEYPLLFHKALENAKEMFKDKAFRHFTDKSKSQFNAAIYDVQMHLAANIQKTVSFDKAITTMEKLFKDEEFSDSIKRATSDENSVRIRFNKMREAFGLK